MAAQRPTRWQKARLDWPGFQWRDLRVGVIGILLAIVILLALGRPGGAVVEVAVVGAAGLAAAVFYAVGQFVWAWLQAPMRLLSADVIAIRERLEATPASVQSEGTLNVRLTLLNAIRVGKALQRMNLRTIPQELAWASGVVEALTVEDQSAILERFLAESKMDAQLLVLEEVVGGSTP
jgi:hypothetical protein